MEAYLLFGGHKQYDRHTYRAIGSARYLQQVFEQAITGWLPHGDNHPSRAWGEIRIDDGKTAISVATWDDTNNKWNWDWRQV